MTIISLILTLNGFYLIVRGAASMNMFDFVLGVANALLWGRALIKYLV